ncbi:hypothetical protein WDV93_04815 [Pantoea ananatis]
MTYPFVIQSVAQTHSLDSLRVFPTGQSRLTAKIHSVKPINQQSSAAATTFYIIFLNRKGSMEYFLIKGLVGDIYFFSAAR